MTISNTEVLLSSDTHMVGTALLQHKAGTDKVLFVAPLPDGHQSGNLLPQDVELNRKTAFYPNVCPAVAQAAFNDLSAGRVPLKSLQGRDLTEMTEYMTKQAK